MFAVDHRGPVLEDPVRTLPNRVLGDPYGQAQLPAILDDVRPDVVLFHHDAYMYSLHRDALNGHAPSARTVVYCPVDSARYLQCNPADLAEVDALVAYTDFGRRVLARSISESGSKVPDVHVIGHGVDTDTFRPLRETRSDNLVHARRALFGASTELSDAFIVLNANRNGPRKRIDLTIEGFARFARDEPDAYLYLHTGMRDRGESLLPIARRVGITDRILATAATEARPRVPDSFLNLVYNACDVGINTCTSEGWGLVAFEHAATGAAQVVPDHGACSELWRDRAVLLDVGDDDAADPHEVASALDRLYGDVGLRERMGRTGQSWARERRFSWDEIGRRWSELLGEVLARPRRRPRAAAGV